MTIKVGELEITKDVLTKVGLSQDQFELLEDAEREAVLKQHGFQTVKQKEPDDPYKKSILEDLQSERAERQRLQALTEQSNTRVSELEQTINDLTEKLNQITKTPNPSDSVSIGDDDFLTGKQFKQLIGQEKAGLEERLKEVTKATAAAIAEAQEVKMQLSEASIAEQYSVEKVGPELEYFNVLEKGTKKMLAENPGYKAVIGRSKNPALEGYKIGLQHPDFAKIVKKKEVDDLTHKIQSAPVKPVTGGGRGGGGTTIDAANMTVRDLMKLSDAELDKIARGEEV